MNNTSSSQTESKQNGSDYAKSGHNGNNGNTNSNNKSSEKQELCDKTRSLAEGVKEIGTLATKVVQNQASELCQMGGESLTAVKETAVKQGEELETYIKNAPIKSVLMGLGAGVAIGYLLTSGRR